MIRRRSNNLRDAVPRVPEKMPSSQEIKKREHKKHDDVAVEHLPRVESILSSNQKGYAGQEVNMKGRPEMRREHKPDVRMDGRHDQRKHVSPPRVRIHPRDLSPHPPMDSMHYSRRNSYGSKVSYSRMDSYNSMTKGAPPLHDHYQYRGYYRSDPHRRRVEYEPEEDELVRAIMRVHRNRFRELMRASENHRIDADHDKRNVAAPAKPSKVPSQEQKVKTQSQTPSSTRSNATVQANGNTSPKMPNKTANTTNGRQKATTKQTPTQQDTEQTPPRNEKAVVPQPNGGGKAENKDEQSDGVTSARRQDAVKAPLSDRRKKQFNDRLPMEGEERTINGYGRFKNKFNGNQKPKVKKDEKEQCA